MYNKIAVLIPSHIWYDKQLFYLKRCITSLLQQTYKSDILLSISFENDIYKQLFYDEIKNNDKYNKIICFESENQKSQFEHFDFLKKHVKYYDYIVFCDDDDYYYKNRVKIMVKKIINKNIKDNTDYLGCSEQHYQQPKDKRFLTGFSSNMIKPIVFITFFDILYKNNMEYYLKKYNCFTLFSNYLQIILWKTNKIFYFKVYDLLCHIEHFNENSYLKVMVEKTAINNKKEFIQNDMIDNLICSSNFNLSMFAKYHRIQNKMKKYIPMKTYAKIKNLIVQFHFVKF